MTMVHVADIKARKAVSKLDPNPRAKQQPKSEKAKAADKPAAKDLSKKDKPKGKSKGKVQANADGGQYLPLGAGYKIAHKPGSAYSIFYSVVAEQGHFTPVAEAFENGKYSISALKDASTAKELLDKMMVPVEKLEDACRCHPIWKEHANKKTAKLKNMVKEGDKAAKEILSNLSRCEDGSWTGNIPEMVSTCVGYYNFLIESDPEVSKILGQIAKLKKGDGKKAAPNKNVKKFEEAGIVFRRYPLNKSGDRSFVMMFPKKCMEAVKQAVKTVHAIDEDEQVVLRLKTKLKELQEQKAS